MKVLQLENINTFYGQSHILWDVSLAVGPGEIVTIIGRNGAGKSTTIRSIMGLTPPRSGKIYYLGSDILGASPHVVRRLGLSLVPEERRLFPNLTLEENLLLATIPFAFRRSARQEIESCLRYFPPLYDKLKQRADTLSGGEQKMAAIARALIGEPKLILMDEPFEGLAPRLVKELISAIRRISAEGSTMLIVGQNVQAFLELGERHYIMDQGKIRYEGGTAELRSNTQIQEKYLGVSV